MFLKKTLYFHSIVNFQKRGLTFISDSSFILGVVALKFGVYMCYFSNKEFAKFARKKNQIWIFHDLLSARQHSQKSSENNKPSSLIIMILQYTKNLQLKFF